jgi:hypothetical protein
MMRKTALEVRTRASADLPLAVVVQRRGDAASDRCVRDVDNAANAEQIEALSLDADASENAVLLDELRVSFVPELLVFSRGIVLDRAAGVRDAADARSLLQCALRRNP